MIFCDRLMLSPGPFVRSLRGGPGALAHSLVVGLYNVWMWRFSLALCFLLRSAYRSTSIFFSRAGIGILSLVKACFPIDTWTSLNQLVPDNDQFWDLAEAVSGCFRSLTCGPCDEVRSVLLAIWFFSVARSTPLASQAVGPR